MSLKNLKNDPFLASFSLFLSFQQLTVTILIFKLRFIKYYEINIIIGRLNLH